MCNPVAIIPARYASTRFPGKPLAMIGNKTMIQRVYEQSKKALESVYVATDDNRILAEVERFGGNCMMTSEHHKSGTDRCSEAIDKIIQKTGKTFDIILCIQGDEPFIQPESIQKLICCFNDPATQIATLMTPSAGIEDVLNPNKPKVITDVNQMAIYFSRSPIPFIRGYNQNEWFTKYKFFNHIGLYAYRYEVLKQITLLPQTPLEIAESLEQLRWIEHGYKIKTEITRIEALSVDTPGDLEQILKMGIIED